MFWTLTLFTFTLTCLIIYWGLIWQSEIINSGKSIIYFIDIYLIGQLLRKTSLITGRIQKYIYIYTFLIIAITIGNFVIPETLLKVFRGLVFAYQSPGLILQSIIVTIIFSKIMIKKRWINNIAGSAFAIYLFHENQYTSIIYQQLVSHIYREYNGLIVAILFILLCLAISLCSIFLDISIRKTIQKNMEPKLTQIIKWLTQNIIKTLELYGKRLY